jgi:hypothetical protein
MQNGKVNNAWLVIIVNSPPKEIQKREHIPTNNYKIRDPGSNPSTDRKYFLILFVSHLNSYL